MPENCVPLKLTTETNQQIKVEYKPKPRIKILEEKFNLSDFPIHSHKAKGIRLAKREVKNVNFFLSEEQKLNNKKKKAKNIQIELFNK